MHRDRIAALLHGIARGHVAHGSVAAVVRNGIPRLHGKAVHGVHAGHSTGGRKVCINDLFLGSGGCKGRQAAAR